MNFLTLNNLHYYTITDPSQDNTINIKKMPYLRYPQQKIEAIAMLLNLLAAFMVAFPDAKVFYTDELSFAVDLGDKSFLCRCPVFNDNYYEVIIITHGGDLATAPVIKVETLNEIFDLFLTMK